MEDQPQYNFQLNNKGEITKIFSNDTKREMQCMDQNRNTQNTQIYM